MSAGIAPRQTRPATCQARRLEHHAIKRHVAGHFTFTSTERELQGLLLPRKPSSERRIVERLQMSCYGNQRTRPFHHASLITSRVIQTRLPSIAVTLANAN